MDSIIFHIDVNSAYLSWSAVRELKKGRSVDLRTVPSIVGGDMDTRHGVVLAKSIPAKKYGIVTGEPVAHALRKCPDLLMVKPDHRYYKEQSRALMNHLLSFCPSIEQVSVDECYMDYSAMKGHYSSPEEAARLIKDSVRDHFGFTVNIGISNRKVLAKMASDFQKPDKVHTLYFHEIQDKMWPLAIDDLYMCGKSTAAAFHKLGIWTIGDLAAFDPAIIESHFKKHGVLLQNYARGIDSSAVKTTRDKEKSIGNSTTVSRDILTREDALPILRSLCESVSSRLKKAHFIPGTVCTEIKYASFQSVSHQCQLLEHSNDVDLLYKTAIKLFDDLWNGDPVRLLGVRTGKLSEDTASVQLSIFDYVKQKPKIDKEQKMNHAMDKIKEKYGDGFLKKGI